MAVVGAFRYQESPIAAVQMLWINLIMDSLASLALATEPPDDALLDRPPVNRSDSIISEQMWYNMVGHAVYQVIVCMFLYFPTGPRFLKINQEDDEGGHHAVDNGQFPSCNSPAYNATGSRGAFEIPLCSAAPGAVVQCTWSEEEPAAA